MKKWIAYIVYFCAVTMAFLYYLFPSDAVKAYVNHHAARLWPQARLSIATVSLALPPGLKLANPIVYQNDQAIAAADYLKVTPGWLSLFSSEKQILIRGEAYDGAINGTVGLSAVNPMPLVDLDLVFGGIQIGKISGISALVTHEINGVAAGRLIYGGADSSAGQAKMEMTVTDCTLSLNPPLLEVRELSFNSIEAEAELADGRIRIDRFNMKGREVNVNASGTIVLRDPLDNSAINISGQVLPHPSFIRSLSGMVPAGLISEKTISGGGIPFRVSGTAADPAFSLK